MLRSSWVKDSNASRVDSSPGADRLGTRAREKRYSKDCRKPRRLRMRGPLKVTRGLKESIFPPMILRNVGKNREAPNLNLSPPVLVSRLVAPPVNLPNSAE